MFNELNKGTSVRGVFNGTRRISESAAGVKITTVGFVAQ